MKLRDAFLFPEPAAPAMPLGEAKSALRGIGDREMRAAQDFLWSMGVSPVPGAGLWAPAQGDAVEFEVPDGGGLRRAGRIDRLAGRDAVVEVNDGEFNIVPVDRLAPLSAERRRQTKQSLLRRALDEHGPKLHETRALIPIGGRDYACTIEHAAGRRPSDDDLMAYVAARYPGARIVDGDDTHPGRVGLVLSFADETSGHRALEASRGAQLVGPDQPPSSRENARGLASEEIEGTGKVADADADDVGGGAGEDLAPIGGTPIISTEKRSAWLAASAEALERLAAAHPVYDIEETSIEEMQTGTVSHFRMTSGGRPLFVRNGALTPTLAEGTAPAIGEVWSTDDGVRVHLAGQPYQSGTGPLSMHENEPGANETGSYVVKADADADAPAEEEDGEHRETIGGPGAHVAVDETAEDYWEDYFGPYGEQLTKDVATHVAGLVHAAWAGEGREPDAEELLWATGVLLTPPVWDEGRKTADQSDEVAKALIESARVSGPARQRLQQLVSGYMAKMDPRMRQRYRPNDPKVWQSILPTILRSMPPKQLNALTYQFAPSQGADRPGLLSRMWNRPGRDREMIERGLEMENLMRPPPAPAPAPAAPAAPGAGAPAPSGGAPAAPPGAPRPRVRGPGRGPARRPGPPAPPGAGGQQRVTIPAGTTVIGPDGKSMRLPADMPASMGALPAGTPPTPPPTAAPPTPAAPPPAAPPAPAAAPTPPAGAPTGPTAGAKQGWMHIPKGARVWDVEGRPVDVRQTIEARVLSTESGVTFVRTADGQVFAIERPGTVAQARKTAKDEHRMPPAKNALHFRMEGLVRRGDWLVATIVWDADAARNMSPGNVIENVKSFVKQRASEKERIDLGFIGKPVIESVDLEMGLAEVRFRSSESRVAPPEVVEREDGDYRELA